ncbi:MAG: hypothetical protein JSW58_06560 [Candidatus Latescibacterota bacterium]|nr:MAG: hypothetical protein JSW58_06560 [Candidatus Latescibacterota bacterium]
MRVGCMVVGLVLLFGVAGSSQLAAQVHYSQKAFYLRGIIGIGTQFLNDVDDATKEYEKIFTDAGIAADFESFGPVLDLAFEVGYRYSQSISTGLAFSYQGNSVDNDVSGFSFAFSDRLELFIVDITGDVSYWPAIARGLFFGVNGGVGYCEVDEKLAFRDVLFPGNDFDLTGKWEGFGPVFGIFAGFEFGTSSRTTLFSKAGFYYRNFGSLDGDVTVSALGIDETTKEPKTNRAGEPVDFDFSGFYLKVGVGVPF